MTDTKSDSESKHTDTVEDLAKADCAGAAEKDAADAAYIEASDAEPDPLDVLREENAVLKDKVLRAMADTENLRKRAEREKAEATLYAATNFARDLLSVSDSLGKALEMMDADARSKADDATRNLVEGIELTRRELLNSFQKHGIVELDPKDEKFDPNFHQAMFEVPGTGKPNGTVVQVVQTGYKIGERVLRPALVGVAKDAAENKS